MKKRFLPLALVASVAAGALTEPAAAQNAQPNATAVQSLSRHAVAVQLLALDAQGNPIGVLKDLKSNANDPTSAFGPPGSGGRFGGDPTPMIQWFQQRAHIALAENNIQVTQRQRDIIQQSIEREALVALDRMKPGQTAGMAIQILIDTPNGAKVMTIAGAFSKMRLPRDVGVFDDTLLPRRDWGTKITDYQPPVIQLTSTPATDAASNAIAKEIEKGCKLKGIQPVFAQAVYNDLSGNIQTFLNGPQPFTYQFRVDKLGIEGAVQAPVALKQNQDGGVGFVMIGKAQSVCQKFQPTPQ